MLSFRVTQALVSIYTTSQYEQKYTTENVLNEKPLIFHSKRENKLFSHATDNNFA